MLLLIRSLHAHCFSLFVRYMPMHDVAPSAVTIAVAILAIICTMNLMVSLLVIIFNVQWLMFNVQSSMFNRKRVGAFAPHA